MRYCLDFSFIFSFEARKRVPKIIIVDDRPEFSVHFTRVAARRRRDLELHEALSGSIAIEALRAEHFDAIIVPSWLGGPVSSAATVLIAAAIQPELRVFTLTHVPGAIKSPSGNILAIPHDASPEQQLDLIVDILDAYEAHTTLKTMTADDFLWLTYATQSTMQISVRDKHTRGGIVFRRGNPVAARFGKALGKDAIIDVLASLDGTLVVENRVADVDPNIHGSYPKIIPNLRKSAVQKRTERERAEKEKAEKAIQFSDANLNSFLPFEEANPLFSADELAEMAFDLEDPELDSPKADPRQEKETVSTKTVAETTKEANSPPSLSSIALLQSFIERYLAHVDGVIGAAVISMIDGSILVTSTTTEITKFEEIIGTYTSIALQLNVGLSPNKETPSLRDFLVHGRSKIVLMIGLPETQVTILAITRRFASPSMSRAYLRARAASLSPVFGT